MKSNLNLGKTGFRFLTIITSSFAAYELLLNQWGIGMSFSILWLILILAKGRYRK